MKNLNFTVLLILLACMLQAQSNGKGKKDFPKVKQKFNVEKPLMAVDFAPEGTFMVSGGAENTIEIREVKGGKVLYSLTGHEDDVNVLACSPKGRIFLSGGADAKIILWDLATGKKVSTFSEHEAPIMNISFSPGGRFVASISEDGHLIVWDNVSGVSSSKIKSDSKDFICASFSPDGKQLVTGDEDGLMKIWDVATGELSKNVEAHKGDINQIVWSKQAKYIASVGNDKVLKVWNPESGTLKASFKGHKGNITKLDVDQSGMMLITGDKAGIMKLWDMTNERFLMNLGAEGMGQINGLAFSPDARELVNVSNEKDIKFWEIPSPEQRIQMMAKDSLYQWLEQRKGEEKDAYRARLKTRKEVRESIKNTVAANFILFYRLNTPWESDIVMEDYDSGKQLFEIESKIFGPLKMMVEPNDADKVVSKKRRMEIRELDLSFEKDDLKLDSMTVYFRGLNRRYVITR